MEFHRGGSTTNGANPSSFNIFDPKLCSFYLSPCSMLMRKTLVCSRIVELPTERHLSCRVEWSSPDCEVERWAGGRRQEAGVRSQEAGGRRQEAGGRRQEAGGRIQEAGGRRQETGGRRQDSGSRGQGVGAGGRRQVKRLPTLNEN